MTGDVGFWLANLERAEARLERARAQARARERRTTLGEGLVAELAAEAAAARDRHGGAVRAARALETRLREREAALTRRRERERQVQSERERAALARETAAAAAQLRALEDEVLGALETVELLAAEAAAREAEATQCRDRAEAGALPVPQAATVARLDELVAEVRACESQLPPDIAATVTKLRGACPPPVVPLEGGACGGCGARPPLQRAIEVEKGRLVSRCQGCGRFLVPVA